jgi:polar amino acid transport system ATP-binding protein
MRHVRQPELYSVDYNVLRQRFLAAARRSNATLFEYKHPLHGPGGEHLFTDVAYLGQRDASKMLVILSGTHGVEGQFGSACQAEWLAANTPLQLPPDTAVLLIHLINPWGTAWSRRVNEDNVDLNRNFIDWESSIPRNEKYAELHDAFVCAQWDGPDRDRADQMLSKAKTVAGGHAGIAATVEAGQYDFADGMFYGGKGPTWSNRTLNDILHTFVRSAPDVIVFDLHTGAGPYGYPALLSVAEQDHDGLKWGKSTYGPALSIVMTGTDATTETGIAATATGYVSAAICKALPDSRVLPLVIECGTLDGPMVMDAVRADNWLHLFGNVESPLGQKIKKALRLAFIPDDTEWQRNCLATSLRYFDRALSELGSIARPDLDSGLAGSNVQANDWPPAVPMSTKGNGQPAVEVRDLHKSFGTHEVLSGVGLSADPGEVVSMIGSSGSGKSTFLRCINLLEQPSRGTIIVDGEEIRMKAGRNGRVQPADMRQVERIRARVGMVFQSFNLWPHMSVLENIIEAPVHVLGERHQDAVEHAHQILKKVGLSEKHAQYPGQLSGGQQQRAAIARTLAMRPKVILLDEPTSALDPELVGEVLRVIRQLAEEGNTMILVTHEMQFAREVSHKILFLHQGKVEEESTPAELFKNPRSERLRQFLSRTL